MLKFGLNIRENLGEEVYHKELFSIWDLEIQIDVL